jgi:hypothetical protein
MPFPIPAGDELRRSCANKAMATRKLPKFRKPPVVEAFCGVSFQDIAGLHAPRLGEFWKLIRADFPLIDTQPPLGPFLPPSQTPQFVFQIGAPIQFRTWFMNHDSTMLAENV